MTKSKNYYADWMAELAAEIRSQSKREGWDEAEKPKNPPKSKKPKKKKIRKGA